jgi:putative restriction endonuclease
MDSQAELHLRRMIFDRLEEIRDQHGVATRADLETLQIDTGEVRRVIDQSGGIWNPADLNATLSVVSSPDGPYADSNIGDSLFAYDYRIGSTNGSNRKLRRAHELELPIILLRKLKTAVFVPIFPVYVVADDIENRRFILALDESLRFVSDPLRLKPGEREYAARVVKLRLHQPEFRGRILMAYQQRCTICNLRHGKLLDAAHIISDGKPHGLPVVENGLSLCKIHHAAYDANLLGISPDYVVSINRELMTEVDGPMLRHGLQEMDGRTLTLPPRRNDYPSKERLAERFDDFRETG